jgi:hypothetical protein
MGKIGLPVGYRDARLMPIAHTYQTTVKAQHRG